MHQASIRLNYLNGNRVSSTVCWNVRQVSLMAQQKNGSSKGPGFWGRVGQRLNNFFHGNGLLTNRELNRLAGTGILYLCCQIRVQRGRQNPYVSYASDVLSVAGSATGHPTAGYIGSALSVGNDYGTVNLTLTAGSFVPVVGEAIGAVGIVKDAAALPAGFITNNIMAPMIINQLQQEANPVTPDGQQVPIQQYCQAAGFC